jgi:hypothetical protein
LQVLAEQALSFMDRQVFLAYFHGVVVAAAFVIYRGELSRIGSRRTQIETQATQKNLSRIRYFSGARSLRSFYHAGRTVPVFRIAAKSA